MRRARAEYAQPSTQGHSRRRTPAPLPPGTVVRVKLSRPARRAPLVVHVAASAGWLGLTLGLLALGATAATTGSAVTVEASVRAMKPFADWLLPPLAFLTLLGGLLPALGTPWGPARHRWVHTKFWLTLATTAATVFALRPGVNSAVSAVAAGEALPDAGDVLFEAGRPSVRLPLHDGDPGLRTLGPDPAGPEPARVQRPGAGLQARPAVRLTCRASSAPPLRPQFRPQLACMTEALTGLTRNSTMSALA